MSDKSWSPADVVLLLDKGLGLIQELVRSFKTPERTLKHIIERTQELQDARRSIDEELMNKYKDRGGE